MNQILSTENKNKASKNKRKSNGGTKDVYSIVRFFAIIIMIFGILLIANSSYALYKRSNNGDTKQQQEGSTKEPTIQAENKGEDKVILTIMHDDVINKVTYSWGEDGEKQVINGDGRKYIQKVIDIPSETSTLYVNATDLNGNEANYSKEYTVDNDIKIEMKQSGNNVKISVTAKNTIKEVAYAWDEEEEKTTEVNDTQYTTEVEVSLGEHDLIVKVTDENGNKQEKKTTVKGITKPTVTIEPGDDCYIIKAHDDVALDRIEIETVEDGKITKMESDGKDFTYKFPPKEGSTNAIKVTAYNSKDVASKVKKAKWTK